MIQLPDHLGHPLVNSILLINVCLKLGAENKMQYSRCSLTSAEKGRIITSLELVSLLLFIQPRPSLLLALAHVLIVYQNAQVLFSRAASQLVSAQPVFLQGLFSIQVQYFVFILAEFHTVPVSLFLQPQSLWIAALPSNALTSHPSLVSSANLRRVHSVASSRPGIKMLKQIKG